MPLSVKRVFSERIDASAAAPALVLRMTGERMACRTAKVTDLVRESGNARRDAITRLWVMSGCKACGQCADMASQ